MRLVTTSSLLAFVMLLGSQAVTAQTAPGACQWDADIGQPGMNNTVWVIDTYTDGDSEVLVAGGAFTMAGGEPANHIARWDGQAWEALGDGMGGISSPVVHALASFDAGEGAQLYAGGAFTTADGEPANRIARWTGEAWEPLGEGVDGNVRAMAVFDDGDGPALYVGGLFSNAGGEPRTGIARWDGEGWSDVGGGVGGGLPHIYSMAVYDDGSGPALYAGGIFFTSGGQQTPNIARWDGEEWSSVGGGTNNWVNGLHVFDDGDNSVLVAGGSFTTAGGNSANRVARWDGETWGPIGGGFAGDWPWVEDFETFDEGHGPALFAAGWFELAEGSVANRIARWDGEAWHALGMGLNERVWSLKTFDDGDGEALYVAGHYTTAGIYSANRIARWVCEPPVSTEVVNELDGTLHLAAYPSPASGLVTIEVTAGSSGVLEVTAFDVVGRRVAELAADFRPAGSNTVTWDVSGLAPGVYVIRALMGESVTSTSLIVR